MSQHEVVLRPAISPKPFILSCILIIHERECNEYALRRGHVAHRNWLKRKLLQWNCGGGEKKSFLRVQKYLLSVASSNRSAGPLKPRMVAL